MFSRFLGQGTRLAFTSSSSTATTVFGTFVVGTGLGFAASTYGPQTFSTTTASSSPFLTRSKLFSFFQPGVVFADSPYADRSYANVPSSNRPVIRTSSNPNANGGAVVVEGEDGTSVVVAQKPRGLRRYLDYQQLTIGSMTGAVSGYVIGKLSKAIVVLLVSGYLATQFLYSRGIPIPGLGYLSHTVVQWGKQKVSLRELLLEEPSFKVSFVSAFIVGAVYA